MRHLEGRGYVKPFAASKNLRDAETGVKIDFLISGQYPGDGKPGPIAFPVPASASKDDRRRSMSSTLVPLIELKLASGQAAHRGRDLGDVQALNSSALDLPRDLWQQSAIQAFATRICIKWEDAQATSSRTTSDMMRLTG